MDIESVEDIKQDWKYIDNFDNKYLLTEDKKVYSVKRGLRELKVSDSGQVTLWRNGRRYCPTINQLHRKYFRPDTYKQICDYDFLDAMTQDYREGVIPDTPEVRQWLNRIHDQIGSEAAKEKWEIKQEEIANSPFKQLDLRKDFYEVDTGGETPCDADETLDFEE